MILPNEECQQLCDWLIEKGLGLGECALFLSNIELGDSFALALLKVFIERKKQLEAIHEKKTIHDWGSPITP